MEKTMKKNIRTRHRLHTRILAMLMALVMCVSMTPVGDITAQAADDSSAVTLNLEKGNVVITPTGFSQAGAAEVGYTGAYIITGAVAEADMPLKLRNETGNTVTYDITLDNVSITTSPYCSAVLIDEADSGIILNLTGVGESRILAYDFPAICNNTEQDMTVNLNVVSGHLTLGNYGTNTPRVISDGDNNALNLVCTMTTEGDEADISQNTAFVSAHEYTDNGDGTHSFGGCDDCGAEAVTKLSHELYYTDNGDGTHTADCLFCGYSASESHDGDGDATDNGDGHSHTVACSKCGYEAAGSHILENGSVTQEATATEAGVYTGVCRICGGSATSPVAPEGGYWIRLLDNHDADAGNDGWRNAYIHVYVNGEKTSLTIATDGDGQGDDEAEFFIPADADDLIVLVFQGSNVRDEECAVELYAPGSSEIIYSEYSLESVGGTQILYASSELADYSIVEEAIASVPGDISIYTSESRDNLLETIRNVVYYLPADRQAEADAYGEAIMDAIEALELCGEDDDPLEGVVSLTIKNNDRLIISSTGYRYGDNGVETPHTGGYHLTTGGNEVSACVLVASGIHSIVVEDLVISYTTSPFVIDSGSGAWLCLEGENTLICEETNILVTTGSNYAGLNVQVNSFLNIDGSGSLYAESDNGAGIGGDNYRSAGQITVSGGEITAVSNRNGAGIGGGRWGDGGQITITGGTVTASSGREGAGIGGGYEGDGGRITISGGTVTAIGGTSGNDYNNGAGIGGGKMGNGGQITISGGTVTASSMLDGAGIGGGGENYSTVTYGYGEGNDYGNSGQITITGGTVTATGGLYAAGIGGGSWGCGEEITISGGTVTATGGAYGGAGIGGGYRGAGGRITISGGIIEANTALTINSADMRGSIIGNGNGNITIEGARNFVLIDGVSVFSDFDDEIFPTPRNSEGVPIYHQGFTTEREDGYASATLSDGSVVLAYVRSNEISLYLPKGVTITEVGDPEADYTEVEALIEEAGRLNKDDYVDFSGVEDAISEVTYGLYADSQDEIDAMAQAIRDAIDALRKICTLSFDTAGGSALDDVVTAENEQIELSGYTTERDGYILVGWSTAADGTGTSYETGEAFTITEDTTLYALWMDEEAYNAAAAVKEKLDAELEAVKELLDGGAEGYTAESWEQLQDAYNAALNAAQYMDAGTLSALFDQLAAAHAELAEANPSTGGDSTGGTATGGSSTGGDSVGNTTGGSSAGTTAAPQKGETVSAGYFNYLVTGDDTVEVVSLTESGMQKNAISIFNIVSLRGKSFKVTSIAKNAFKGNKKIAKVTIGNNIISIGANAFAGCTSLKKVTIKSKVLKSIGKQAFKGDKKLIRITLKTTKLKSVGKKALSGISAKCVIKAPKAKKAAYTKLFRGKGQKSTVKVK